jgi:hypothetical protein
MPYVRYVKTKKGISVYKRLKSGRVVKAFTAHTRSVPEAKRRARLRERRGRG